MYEKEDILIDYINNEINTVPFSLNDKLKIRNEKFRCREEFYEIKNYVDDFLEGNYTNRYIVLPGLRGLGKTTIIYQLYQYLLREKEINHNQILYISCDDLNDYMDINILDVVNCFLKLHHNSNLRTLDKKIFIFIDESQYDSNWAGAGKRIYDKTNNVFLIFTGSSALNLEYNADSARRLLKKSITPLNYGHFLKLKYGFHYDEFSDALSDLIFLGDEKKAIQCEREVYSKLYNLEGYNDNVWDDFLRNGGFPISFYEKNDDNVSQRLREVVKKVLISDIANISTISSEKYINSIRLLNFLAVQKPGDISQNKLANFLNVSPTTVKGIIDLLEKTHLIFHTEPYGSAAKRSKKSWKYFFASSSLKHALVKDLGSSMRDVKAYEGILLENLVASTFFNWTNRKNISFNLFYDANDDEKNKTTVDFIIKEGFNKPIPIEVGIGKKGDKHISKSISDYRADYGIVISNKTKFIERQGNVIYLPPRSFSFL